MGINKSVAIIIANYNGESTKYGGKPILSQCIKSLATQSYKNRHIIVADDDSIDKSRNLVRSLKAVFVLNKPNGGFAKNNNTGIRYALNKYNPDYVLLLNSDVLMISKSWLGDMVAAAEADKTIGIVGCKLLYPNGKIQHAGVYGVTTPRNRGRAEDDKGQYNMIEDFDCVTGGAFLIKKDVINKIGFLDENFYMGMEDVDYCIRAKKSGFRIIYNGSASAIHLEGYTRSKIDRHINEKYLFLKNQTSYTYFAYKNLRFIEKIEMMIILLAECIFSIESKDRTRSIMHIRLKKGAGWKLLLTFRSIYAGRKLYKTNKVPKP